MEFPQCGVCRQGFSPDPASDLVPISSSSCSDSVCRGCLQRLFPTTTISDDTSMACPSCGEAWAFSQQKQLINKKLCDSLRLIASMQQQQSSSVSAARTSSSSGLDHLSAVDHDQTGDGQRSIKIETFPNNIPNNDNALSAPQRAAPNKPSLGIGKGTKGHWKERVQELKEFQQQNGHCRVPHKYHPNLALGYFVCNIRKFYRVKQAGKPSSLTDAQIEELNALGFLWNVHGPLTNFDDRLKHLQEFATEHGHLRVPAVKTFQDGRTNPWRSLGMFVADMRKEYKLYQEGKKSRLNEARVQALEQLGMEWMARNLVSFPERLKQLHEFYAEHQHYRVDRETHPGLKIWVEKIRLEYKRIMERNKSQSSSSSSSRNDPKKPSKVLPPEKLQALEDINFDWTNDSDYAWNKRYEELKAFQQKHGHLRVGSTLKQREALANWVSKQREHHRLLQRAPKSRSKSLTPDRVARLNALGFEWNPMENEQTENTGTPKSFEDRLQELRDYYKEHNNYRVSKTTHKGLKWWVDQVRADYKKCQAYQQSVDSDDAARLSSTPDKTYDKEAGQVTTPSWKEMVLTSQERIDDLKAINFDWDTDREYEWSEEFRKYFGQLRAFHKEHGHCQLPRSATNPLSRWASKLRDYAKKCKKNEGGIISALLIPERVEALHAIGFEWTLSRERKSNESNDAATTNSGLTLGGQQENSSQKAPAAKKTQKSVPKEPSISKTLLLAAANELSLATTTSGGNPPLGKSKSIKSKPPDRGCISKAKVPPPKANEASPRHTRKRGGPSKVALEASPPTKKVARAATPTTSTGATRMSTGRNLKAL